MRKSVIVLAALAAAISTAALAAEKEKKTTVPATATQMSDSEMDKVTAGDSVSVNNRGVNLTQPVGSGGQSGNRNPSNGFNNSAGNRGACFNCAGF